jgi:hypothetical protein
LTIGQTFMPGVSNVLNRAVLPRSKSFNTPPRNRGVSSCQRRKPYASAPGGES